MLQQILDPREDSKGEKSPLLQTALENSVRVGESEVGRWR